jgi:NADH-quinone oxidoreductase subunit F
MADAQLLDDLDVTIARGPDEYLYGEEKAMLEVIEGNDPLPRVLPPFQHGLFATAPQLGWTATEAEPGEPSGGRANPTLVNNVETLAQTTWILSHDADEFRAEGTERSPGTMVFTVCGDVVEPRVFELPLGTTVRTLIDAHAGGVAPGRQVKLVASGVANPVLPGTAIDTPADFESLAAAGAGLGSAGFIVYDDTACALAIARLFSRFLYVESCGQCPPCKLQSGEITDALERIERDGDSGELARIQRALETVADGNRCFLAVEEQQVVSSILRRFPEDVVAHEEGRCNLRHDLVVPKIVDFDGNDFVYDAKQARKRPDWTYA